MSFLFFLAFTCSIPVLLSVPVFSPEGICGLLEDERKKLGESVIDFKFNKKRVKVIQGNDGDLARECKVSRVKDRRKLSQIVN